MSAVLIVEDEKHLADGLRYNLKAEGYEVDVARTAEEAFPLLVDRQPSYDVIVLDVMLPGMDGFSLATQLRSQGH
ncbi:MAG TPA: response regulator, partial [Pyrinomonadaceae bacterium]|nr:response regulator [Pyrinomonadaceae bacterium]